MEKERNGKLQLHIDIVLTVLFIITIFYFLIGTIVFEHGLWGHTFYMHYVSKYLDDPFDYTVMELVEASKDSLNAFISSHLHGTDALGQINSTFQYALGKKLVSTGGTQMIRLNSGHMFDVNSEVSMESGVQDIVNMRAIVPEDTPFVFVYEHSTLYDEEAQMPEGYGFLDFSTQEADEVVTLLRERGIDVIDSRDVFRESGLTLDEFLMYTDQHWATRASIAVAQRLSERIEEVTGTQMHSELLDIDRFDTEVYPKLFMGKYGQRLGPLVIEPDDIITYSPKYETHIRRHTSRYGKEDDLEGTFAEANLRADVLKPDPGRTWNIRAYFDYGLTEDYDIMTNEAGADCTVLLLKDSFSASVGRFLSLVADEVYCVDLRTYYAGGSLQDWIDRSDPDVVVVAYSLQMLRNENYEFE